MSERILITDTISNVYRDESYIGSLSASLADYTNALNDYVSDYSKVKVKLVGLDYYTTNEIAELSVVLNDHVYFDIPFYEEGSVMGYYQVMISSNSGNISINDGNLEDGWTLKLYIEEEEPEPGPEPTPSNIPLKGVLEQIADVLEEKASIEHEDKGYLDTETYEHRIVKALEKYYNVEYEDKGNLNEKDYLQRLLEVAKNI